MFNSRGMKGVLLKDLKLLEIKTMFEMKNQQIKLTELDI